MDPNSLEKEPSSTESSVSLIIPHIFFRNLGSNETYLKNSGKGVRKHELKSSFYQYIKLGEINALFSYM